MKEKVQAAPKTLVRRGLEDGTQRLRGQLRDAAHGGRTDDYGGDRIEDTAAGGARLTERGIESLLKKKKASRCSDAKGRSPSSDVSEPNAPAAGPEAEPPAPWGGMGADPPAPKDADRPRIKTRDAIDTPTVRNGGRRTVTRRQREAVSAQPKCRVDRSQIKTREAVSHASPEAGRPTTAPAQRVGDISNRHKGQADTLIKTRGIRTSSIEGSGTPTPVDSHGASSHPAPFKPTVKTKESYITQNPAPADVPQPMSQGIQGFVQEQGRTAAIRQAEIRRGDKRPGSETVGSGDVSRQSYTDRHPSKQTPARATLRTEQTPSGTVREGGESIRRGARKVEKLSKNGRKVRNTIKAVERPTGRAVRAAGRTARTAQNAARAAQRAAQTAKATTKAASTTVRNAAKAAAAAAKGAIAALKALAGALAAGGSVVVAVVLVICLAGLLIASPFGIFFADGSSPDTVSPSAAIVLLGGEFSDKLTELQAGGGYDRVEIQGGIPAWAEVFAVFAAKTAAADNALPVAVLDAEAMERLRTVFWDMTKITTVAETIDHPASGDTPAWTETVLTITVTPRTTDDMRVFYSFTGQQNAMLDELLTPESLALWSDLLYGTSGGIVAVALSQVGNVGGQPYWSWYGFDSRVEWCACFVSWCANECGYIDAGTIPKFASCSRGVRWFKARDLWQENDYEPRPGDIAFFDWDNKGSSGPQDDVPDHVGIVERVENGIIYTVEGNSGDSCCQRSYSVGHYEVFGYGTPSYMNGGVSP